MYIHVFLEIIANAKQLESGCDVYLILCIISFKRFAYCIGTTISNSIDFARVVSTVTTFRNHIGKVHALIEVT